MDKKRYPKKRDAQLNSEMHSFLCHTDFGGSDHHRKKHPNLLTRFMYFSAMSAILIVWTTPLKNFYFTPFSNSVHMMTYEAMIMKYPISHEKITHNIDTDFAQTLT